MTTPTAAPPVTDEGLRCLTCDYNLTGLTSDRCPECGTVIDWPTVQAIPVRVYISTVLAVPAA